MSPGCSPVQVSLSRCLRALRSPPSLWVHPAPALLVLSKYPRLSRSLPAPVPREPSRPVPADRRLRGKLRAQRGPAAGAAAGQSGAIASGPVARTPAAAVPARSRYQTTWGTRWGSGEAPPLPPAPAASSAPGLPGVTGLASRGSRVPPSHPPAPPRSVPAAAAIAPAPRDGSGANKQRGRRGYMATPHQAPPLPRTASPGP